MTQLSSRKLDGYITILYPLSRQYFTITYHKKEEGMYYHGFVVIALCALCAVGPAAHAQDSCLFVISAHLETIGMPRQIGEIVRYHEEGNELLGKVVYRYQKLA